MRAMDSDYLPPLLVGFWGALVTHPAKADRRFRVRISIDAPRY